MGFSVFCFGFLDTWRERVGQGCWIGIEDRERELRALNRSLRVSNHDVTHDVLM